MADASNSAGAPAPAHAWRRLLDVSTAHLCERTRERMATWQPHDAPVALLAHHSYGWFMWVPEEPDAPGVFAEVPPDLEAVLRYAHGQGATHVSLDCDGAHHPALPTYDGDQAEPEGYADWLREQEDEAAAAAERAEDARLGALEVAYLDGEIPRSQWANGGA